MPEEIKFFGFGTSKKPAIENLNRVELAKYHINLPGSCSFTQDEIRSSDPSLFPWPVLIRIPTEQDAYAKSVRVNTWEEMQNILDEVRNPNQSITLSLPPQAASNPCFRYVYAYVGVNFTYVHNVASDSGVMLQVDNSKLFFKIGAGDSILRLIRGHMGWSVDSVFDANDPRFQPIKNLSSDFISSHSDPFRASHSDTFRTGYLAGFYGSNHVDSLPRYFGPKSLVGDPYTFGFRIGCRIRADISRILGENTQLDKHTVIKLRLSCSEAEFNTAIKIVNLHNKIISGEVSDMQKDIAEYMNPKCHGVIQNTFIACGEEGQYCSNDCEELAKINKGITNSLDYAVRFLEEAASCHGEYSGNQIDIPNVAATIKNVFYWYSENCQFRVVSSDSYFISLRFQSRKPELLNDIEYDGDVIKTIVFKETGNVEYDITLRAGNVGLSPEDFYSLVQKISAANFCNSSNYSGSHAKYATLIFKSDIGFCLEDGTIVIPQDEFFKHLRSVKGSNFKLYNGV